MQQQQQQQHVDERYGVAYLLNVPNDARIQRST
jgi:hypothetical protein